MWIYLLRHGVAEEPRAGLTDEQRALTEEGMEKLRRASPAWRRLVHTPSVVMCSPLVRARQTAAQFVQAVDCAVDLQIDDALTPSADPSRALTALEGEMLSRTDSVAVVGHEPHLGYLLGALLTGHPRQSIPLKKGMLVGLQVEGATTILAGLRFSLSTKAAAQLT